MEADLDEFFREVRNEILAGAEARSDFHLSEFVSLYSNELIESGNIESIDICHYSGRGIRVDGFWFNEDGGIDLFIADFESRDVLATLTASEVTKLLGRLTNFYTQCVKSPFYEALEETSPTYGLSRDLHERHKEFGRINLYLFSERKLSDQFKELETNHLVNGVPIAFHIWDISRLFRMRSAKGAKEPIKIDLIADYGRGIPCLPAHLGSAGYQSYLLAIPGELIADLYARYGSRLLEQNVRSFLQARNAVNKGIRNTILSEPEMFFAYNNGITATATDVQVAKNSDGLVLNSIDDLQIVNGGQTTASLFHTRRKDKANLEKIFVQMKLSIVDLELAETLVPKISEYANTQNRVNAADFYSNHPFHIKMEEFSRRLWAPASEGTQKETKWFYERARGQFADAQSKLTPAEKRRFLIEYPKSQMFTKTDLAKFENVWDDHPRFVNLGAQKNFAAYAKRIGEEWASSPKKFDELYFKRIIARDIIFRRTEKIVSAQAWYQGGYRANIVAYTIAMIGQCLKEMERSLDMQGIWQRQGIDPYLYDTISVIGELVHDDLTAPPPGISNISEWAKKEDCWQRLLSRIEEACDLVTDNLKGGLIPE